MIFRGSLRTIKNPSQVKKMFKKKQRKIQTLNLTLIGMTFSVLQTLWLYSNIRDIKNRLK